MASYAFNLAGLVIPNSDENKIYTNYVEKILGLSIDENIFTDLFPYGSDFFLFLVMAVFV